MNDAEPAAETEMIALLRADAALPGAAVKARVSSRLVQSLGAAALQRVAGPAQPPARMHAASALLHALRAQPLAFVASFALGTAFGAGISATRHAEPARIVYVERQLATLVATAVPVATAAPAVTATTKREEAAASASPTRAVPADTVTPSASRAGSASLAEQQALLDLARSAFARSDYETTLRTLQAHFRRYPKSMLGEEREALEIKALAASGREAEAKAQATRFRVQFPRSLLMPSVSDSVGAIP